MSDSRAPAPELDPSNLDSLSKVVDPADQGLALVEREADFGDRYRVWRGRSGRRYLVTVMPLGEAVRVENAVVLVVAVEPEGRRRVIWAGLSENGLPGFHIAPGVQLEAHVHLIAASEAKRRIAVEDLISATQGYAPVLATSAAASQASVGSVTPIFSSSRTVFST